MDIVRRIRSRRILVLGVMVLASAAVVGALASQTLARRASSRVPSVLSPRNGQRLAARPALVKIYLGSAQLVGARLNGRRIGTDLQFGPVSRLIGCANLSVSDTRGKTCQLEATPSHGLRYGVNVLTVRFKLGRSALVRTVRFRVAGDRPLAAAGRNRYAEPGTRIRLDGRGSLMPPGLVRRLAGVGKRARLRYRWRIVQAPSTGGWMVGADTATPSLVPRSAGTYRVRLTVISPDGRSGTAVLIIRSANQGNDAISDAAPLVGVKTMVDRDGKWGVELNTYRDIKVQGCGDQGTNSVSFSSPVLGQSCFYADPGQARDWVQLVVLNRFDLSLVANRTVPCPYATLKGQEHDFDFSAGGDVYYHNGNQCIRDLVDYLNGLASPSNDLVIAVNQPGDAANRREQPPVGVGAALSGKFIQPFDGHNLGIGATGWFDAPGNGRDLAPAVRGTFSAVGVPGWTTGGVLQMPADPSSWDPQGAGRLETNIAINNVARYAPLSSPPPEVADSPLIKVLTQQPTPWPADGSDLAGGAAALSAIAAKVGMTSDPRTFYYSAPSTENWASDLTAISNIQYSDFAAQSASTPRFSVDAFNWAKKQLSEEVFWITKVDTYTGALAAPYGNASKTLWADFQQSVSQIVNTETANKAGAKAFAAATQVIGGLIDLLPVAGQVLKWSEFAKAGAKAFGIAYKFGLKFAEHGGQPSDSGFSTETANLGSELAHRLDDAEEEISSRWRDIVVADYGKLRTAALCSTASDQCTDQRQGWSLTKNSVTNMEALVKVGLERYLFATLVPARYPLALGLEPVSQDHAQQAINDAAKFCQPFPPFEHTTGVYLWPVVDSDYWAGTPRQAYHPPPSDWADTPIVLTSGDPGPFQTWHAASWTVFGRMFNALDSGGDLSKGGLGIDEEQFMSNNYGLNGSSYTITDKFRPFINSSLNSCGKGWTFG